MDRIDKLINEQMVYKSLARASGKSFAIAEMCKHNKKHGVIVPDYKHMDRFIKMGVQPSQIVVMSEQEPRNRMFSVMDEGTVGETVLDKPWEDR